MNVCILGERSQQLDEGMKNFSIQLYDRLKEKGIETTLVDLREIGSIGFWQSISSAEPDVVHLVPGPTGKGLALLKSISQWKRCATAVTVTQPRFNRFSQKFIRYLQPNLVFVQSESEQAKFDAFNCTTELLPSGVDLTRFTPSTKKEQETLRAELNLPQEERIFLHVGHFKRGRGVESLLSLQSFGHLVVVGSPSTGPEVDLVDSLRNAGVTVQTEYVPDIEKYYRAVDVYVFPVADERNSIQAPLSVFEAMACNLPVVSTQFGGLTDFFDTGNGLRFVSSFRDIGKSDFEFKDIMTRDKVKKYSWNAIVKQVIESYERLCNAEH